MFIRVGWQDAGTVNGALGTLQRDLERAAGVHRPVGPRRPQRHRPLPPGGRSGGAGRRRAVRRARRLLRRAPARRTGSGQTPTEIHYYTLGADRWTRDGDVASGGVRGRGAGTSREGGALSRRGPRLRKRWGGHGTSVDFTRHDGNAATAGTRMAAAGDVVYGDRRGRGREAAHVHEPAARRPTLEITGHPVAHAAPRLDRVGRGVHRVSGGCRAGWHRRATSPRASCAA